MFEVFIDSFSGATGGFFATLLLYPIENFRTRLQTISKERQSKVASEESSQSQSLEQAISSNQQQTEEEKKFTVIKFLKEIIKKEGFLTFYKGLESGLIGTVSSYAIYFWWYRFWKNFFYHILKRKELSEFDITLITAIAGSTNAFLTNPIWFVNTRMTLSKEKKTIKETIKEIYNNEGLGAFYKGVLPNMILVLNPIINFVIYEFLKKQLIQKKYQVNFAQLFLISSIAKTIATFCTYPILTVRVKLQASHSEKQRGLISFILKIIKQVGINGLYIGVFAKLLQTVLYNAFLMVTYEKLRRLIKYLLFQYLTKTHKIKA